MGMDQDPRETRPEPRIEPGSVAGENPAPDRPAGSWEGYSPEVLAVVLEG
jgi:hypothetical protein